MRALICLLLVLTASTAVRAGSLTAAPRDRSREPQCAFADEPFMTMMAILSSATEYYAAHRSWPSTTEQLRAQVVRSFSAVTATEYKPSAKDIDAFFARFSQITLRSNNKDLIVEVRYRSQGRSYHRKIMLHPGKSTDEMLQASSEIKI